MPGRLYPTPSQLKVKRAKEVLTHARADKMAFEAAKTAYDEVMAGHDVGRLDISPRKMRVLGRIGAKKVEIAEHFGISRHQLDYELQKRPELAAAYKQGRADLKLALRKKQIDLAMGGDLRMLIWLGKQHLGQSESPDAHGREAEEDWEVKDPNSVTIPRDQFDLLLEGTIRRWEAMCARERSERPVREREPSQQQWEPGDGEPLGHHEEEADDLEGCETEAPEVREAG